MTGKRHKRVRWRVRRCPDGWLPVVLIGEEPWSLGVQPTKHLARDVARARAKYLNAAQVSA